MSLTGTSIRKLRSDPRIHKVPPYISLICILGGIFWLLLLPLNQYSRQTYISENALLPGQVHTYFAGSEQHIFRGYREELRLHSGGSNKTQWTSREHQDRLETIKAIFKSAGLPTATQRFRYRSGGRVFAGVNVYSVIQAPRGDGTEAIVLVAPEKNFDGKDNTNGVALLLTLARYFKRWSLWSKDIILLVTPDTESGPQAWISAYHSTHDAKMVESLSLKSGALQGAVGIDLPLNHRFEKLEVAYDGINGQLPNLDLVNTAVSVASGQMGIPALIQGMYHNDDSYRSHVSTMLKGMSNQALGQGTGVHSVFMPYHIDAITLTAVGEGWQDEMALGRTVESICRSLNNLLEHFHQSFFFYLLMQTNRFVSIGTYLPSAMAIAAGFTIMAIHLWIRSGAVTEPQSQITGEKSKAADSKKVGGKGDTRKEEAQTTRNERELFQPILTVLTVYLLSLLPLQLTHHVSTQLLSHPSAPNLISIAMVFVHLALPSILARYLSPLSDQSYQLTRSLSLLILGLLLSTLATLNFSLSLLLGLVCVPILFATRTRSRQRSLKVVATYVSQAALVAVSPMSIWLFSHAYFGLGSNDQGWATRIVGRTAFGWNVLGSWGVSVGIWVVWFPAWLVTAILTRSNAGHTL